MKQLSTLGDKMKISLNMIKDNWNFKDSSITICDNSHIFYDSIRIITSSTSVLEDNTLYLLTAPFDSISQLTFSDNCGIIYTDENVTEFPLSIEYAYIESKESGIDIFNALLSIIDKYNAFEKELANDMYSDNPLQSLIDSVCNLLKNPGYIIDRSFHVIVMNTNPELDFISINWKRIHEHGYLPYNVVSSILNNSQWKEIRKSNKPLVVTTDEFSTPFMASNIRYKSQIHWQFFICEIFKEITQGDLDIITLSYDYFYKCLISDKNNFSRKGNYHEYFFGDVISGKLTNNQLIDEQLKPLKWKLNGVYCILETDSNDDNFYDAISSKLEQLTKGKSLLYENRFITVCPLKDYSQYKELINKLSSFYENMEFTAILSDAFNDFSNLRIYINQTKSAMAVVKNMNISKNFLLCRDFVFTDMLSKINEDLGFDTLVDSTLNMLKIYDDKHNSDFYKTLYAYLQNDRNLVHTSKALSIHRNTLVYRLEKIESLLPLTLDDPEYRFRLLFSYKIIEYFN